MFVMQYQYIYEEMPPTVLFSKANSQADYAGEKISNLLLCEVLWRLLD